MKHSNNDKSGIITKTRNPEMLTPTYWGSLAAIFVGIIYTTIASIHSGPPAHVAAIDNQSAALPLFYGTLFYVFLFSSRYYCAVCINIYGGSKAASHWPKGRPRRVAFSLLSTLVLLALSSVAAVIAFGLQVSIIICLFMAGISFLMFFGVWLLSYVDPNKYGTIQTSFGLGDLGLFLISFLTYKFVAEEVDNTSVISFFILTALLGIFFIVEFRRRFYKDFRYQYKILLNSLDQ